MFRECGMLLYQATVYIHWCFVCCSRTHNYSYLLECQTCPNIAHHPCTDISRWNPFSPWQRSGCTASSTSAIPTPKHKPQLSHSTCFANCISALLTTSLPDTANSAPVPRSTTKLSHCTHPPTRIYVAVDINKHANTITTVTTYLMQGNRVSVLTLVQHVPPVWSPIPTTISPLPARYAVVPSISSVSLRPVQRLADCKTAVSGDALRGELQATRPRQLMNKCLLCDPNSSKSHLPATNSSVKRWFSAH